MTLTLPDICGKVAFPRQTNPHLYDKWGNLKGEGYRKWFDTYARPADSDLYLFKGDKETFYHKDWNGHYLTSDDTLATFQDDSRYTNISNYPRITGDVCYQLR